MAGTHLRMDAKGVAVRQEILFGKFEEERSVDVLMGREARYFKWMKEMMEDEEERETLRAHGRAVAVAVVIQREEKIGTMTCDICMVSRMTCDNAGVHFSREHANVGYCNEVRVVCGVWSAERI